MLEDSSGALLSAVRIGAGATHRMLGSSTEGSNLASAACGEALIAQKRDTRTDVALAVDALQVGVDGKIDIAVLVTGDGDFVPLVRALNKQGVRVLCTYFTFDAKDGKKSFINERLLSVANYAVDVNALESDKGYKQAFKSLFRKDS